MNRVYLASGSPRRYEILQNLGYCVERLPSEIDETPYAGEAAADYVLRMAQQKNRAALAAFAGLPEYAVISADTAVALNGRILGKPRDADDARQILSALSGSIHQVLTAVCVSFCGQVQALVQSSDVQFRVLGADEIDRYIAGGEPMDKAGAYGIQGAGGVFVQHLSGSFTGVMGLPVFETVQLLRRLGAPVPPFAD